MISFLYVAIGGFFGAILRFYISEKCNKHFIGTWVVNISGSVLLAVLFRLYMNDALSETIWLLFGVGFSGAYTTFSTFGNETIQLLLTKQYKTACYYVISSLTISLLFVGIIFVW